MQRFWLWGVRPIGLILGVWVSLAGSSAARAHEIIVEKLHLLHPHTFEPAEAMPAELPVFMVVKNTGPTGDRIIAARSDFARSVAIGTRDAAGHFVAATGGIDLPGNSEVVVGPQTIFVMLQSVTEPVVGYAYFPMVLTLEKAGQVEIEVAVEDASVLPGGGAHAP